MIHQSNLRRRGTTVKQNDISASLGSIPLGSCAGVTYHTLAATFTGRQAQTDSCHISFLSRSPRHILLRALIATTFGPERSEPPTVYRNGRERSPGCSTPGLFAADGCCDPINRGPRPDTMGLVTEQPSKPPALPTCLKLTLKLYCILTGIRSNDQPSRFRDLFRRTSVMTSTKETLEHMDRR